jgi:hypothetical protein
MENESSNVHSAHIYTVPVYVGKEKRFINMRSLLTLSLATVAFKCHQYSGRHFKDGESKMQAI